jgi:hypothetical protein
MGHVAEVFPAEVLQLPTPRIELEAGPGTARQKLSLVQ